MAKDRGDRTDGKEKLTPEQVRIVREGGTEPAFTGEYWDTKTPGTYVCVCCGKALFRSGDKYDSGSGWPSFTRPVDGEAVATARDASLGMERIEARCRSCQAHLGHMFPDGPKPTGVRFCINSAALKLEEDPAGGETP